MRRKGKDVKKILIVDDDPDIRKAIKIILENKYELKEAGGREEARELAKTFKPELVVLDVMMETTSSGFELSREFKKDKRLGPIKILMLTSVDAAVNIDFKSSAGDPEWLPVDDYLSKPIEPKVLLQKVNNLIA
jgi:CheY-like chemotaxis protein